MHYALGPLTYHLFTESFAQRITYQHDMTLTMTHRLAPCWNKLLSPVSLMSPPPDLPFSVPKYCHVAAGVSCQQVAWSPGTLAQLTVHALSQCLLFTCSACFKIHCRLFMQLEARQTEVPTSEVWSPSVAYRHIVSKRTLRF